MSFLDFMVIFEFFSRSCNVYGFVEDDLALHIILSFDIDSILLNIFAFDMYGLMILHDCELLNELWIFVPILFLSSRLSIIILDILVFCG